MDQKKRFSNVEHVYVTGNNPCMQQSGEVRDKEGYPMAWTQNQPPMLISSLSTGELLEPLDYAHLNSLDPSLMRQEGAYVHMEEDLVSQVAETPLLKESS